MVTWSEFWANVKAKPLQAFAWLIAGGLLYSICHSLLSM